MSIVQSFVLIALVLEYVAFFAEKCQSLLELLISILDFV